MKLTLGEQAPALLLRMLLELQPFTLRAIQQRFHMS